MSFEEMADVVAKRFLPKMVPALQYVYELEQQIEIIKKYALEQLSRNAGMRPQRVLKILESSEFTTNDEEVAE